MVNIEYFIGLVVYECCGCIYLFTAHGSCTAIGGQFPLEKKFVGLRYFLLFMIIFETIICFKKTFFRKAMIGGVLNVSLYPGLIFSICQCRFGNDVIDN